MNSPKQPEQNDLAIASLVLGILSLVGMGPLTGIPAIITGWIGLKKNHVNKGMNIAGIVMGSISVAVAVLVLLFFLFIIIMGAFAVGISESESQYEHSSPSDSSFHQQRT